MLSTQRRSRWRINPYSPGAVAGYASLTGGALYAYQAYTNAIAHGASKRVAQIAGRAASRNYASGSYSGKHKTRSKAGGGGGTVRVARGGRKRAPQKRGGGGKRRKVSLKQRVTTLEHYGKKLAVHDHRALNFGRLDATINQARYQEDSAFHVAFYEGQMASVRYFDRQATPGIDNIDLRNQSRLDVWFGDIYMFKMLKNNASLPVDVSIYWYKRKMEGGTTVLGDMATDDVEIGISDAITNMQMFPSDFKLVRANWDLIKSDCARLNAGDELSSVCTLPKFKYDPTIRDGMGSPIFMKGDVICLSRIRGVLCHDVTDPAKVGFGDGAVDTVLKRKFKLRYVSDSTFLIVNNAVTGTPPVDCEITGPNVVTIEETT